MVRATLYKTTNIWFKRLTTVIRACKKKQIHSSEYKPATALSFVHLCRCLKENLENQPVVENFLIKRKVKIVLIFFTTRHFRN